MKKLIRQIRSLGSPSEDYGVHVLFITRKPEVSFKAPTYMTGGSDCSFARQGGFISMRLGGLETVCSRISKIWQAFMTENMFLRGNIDNNTINCFDYRLDFQSYMKNLGGGISPRPILLSPSVS